MKKEKGAAIVVVLFVWGLAGALFGSLFAGLHQVLQVVGLDGWQPLVVGAAAAAMTTSAFYSSMPVALAGAMAGVMASIGYLMVTGHQVRLLFIAGIWRWRDWWPAPSMHGWERAVCARWRKPWPGCSGHCRGRLLALGLSISGAAIGMFPLAAGVVALVGGLFQVSRRWIVSTTSAWCPQSISAPMVAGLIAAVVGASVWIMGGTTAAALDATTKGAIDGVIAQVPSGFLGGMLGGAVSGVLLELIGVHPENAAREN